MKISTHLSYDGLGRVWQRWEFDTVAEEWASTLKRFVYNGNTLSQEIETSYEEEVFSYSAALHDYLRKPDGVRDKADLGSQVYEDRYLLTDKGQITARVKRETTSSVVRQELTVSGERQSGGSTQDAQISNLGAGGGYVEGYGGGNSGDTQYFDPLMESGGTHFLPSLCKVLTKDKGKKYCPEFMQDDTDGDQDVYIEAAMDCFIHALEYVLEGTLEEFKEFEEILGGQDFLDCMDECLPDDREATSDDYLDCWLECLLKAFGWNYYKAFKALFVYIKGMALILSLDDICMEFNECMQLLYGEANDKYLECCTDAFEDKTADLDLIIQTFRECLLGVRYPEDPCHGFSGNQMLNF